MAGRSVRIVVYLERPADDGSLLPAAAELAGRLGAEVVLLRVIAPPDISMLPNLDVLPPVDLAERQAERELRRLAAALFRAPVTCVVLVGTRPDFELAHWLNADPVDFVLMRARPRGVLRRLFGDALSETVQRSPAALITIGAESPPRLRSA